MAIFKNISNFSNTSDYLPIINGVLVVETIILGLALVKLKHSKYLRYWYKVFGLSAVLAEVTLVTIGIVLTRFVYHYFFKTFSIWTFILLAIAIQITHDLLFYSYLRIIPYNTNLMFDIFKKYTNETGVNAIFRNSIIMASSCLFSSYLATQSLNINIINLLVTLYIIPYALHA